MGDQIDLDLMEAEVDKDIAELMGDVNRRQKEDRLFHNNNYTNENNQQQQAEPSSLYSSSLSMNGGVNEGKRDENNPNPSLTNGNKNEDIKENHGQDEVEFLSQHFDQIIAEEVKNADRVLV
jgi:hypothetical protein